MPIGLIKSCLRKSYNVCFLDYVDLLTAVYGIANILNSRPLTYVSTDEVIAPLTSNYFLWFKTEALQTHLDMWSDRHDSSERKFYELWKDIKGVIENLWSEFGTQYLTYLREKYKRSHVHPKGFLNIIPKVNDNVLVMEPGAPGCIWKTGRIMSLNNRNSVAVF